MCDKYQHRTPLIGLESRVSRTSLNSVGSILFRDLCVFVWMIWWMHLVMIVLIEKMYFNDGTCAPVVLKMRNQTINYFRSNVVYLRLDHITRYISPNQPDNNNGKISRFIWFLFGSAHVCSVQWNDRFFDRSKLWPRLRSVFTWVSLMFADRSINFMSVEMISMPNQSTLTTHISRIKWKINGFKD